MKAIRVLKKGYGTLFAVHLLSDEEETVCGRELDRLNIVEDLDVDALPPVEGCGSCRRIAEGWERIQIGRVEPDRRVTLEPSLGTFRKTGPLVHGFRARGGSRLR